VNQTRVEVVEFIAERVELRGTLLVIVVTRGSFCGIKLAQVVHELFASRI